MTNPGSIVVADNADQFVDELMDELFGAGANGTGPGSSGGEDQDEDSGDSNPPPSFWQGPINTGPVSFDRPVDDPVTSGGDGVAGDGVVDTGPSNQQ
jgi:hypothetical protein